ncbi:MAG: DUF111 family protein, partial [Oscillospiraceae bacterium]|nr:DUF111 family protein [Oscillospiraceae bacterium]
MRELYIDCSCGAAGDMLSAALLELCPDREEMLRRLNALGIPQVEYSARKINRQAIEGTRLSVTYLGEEEEQDSQGF